MQNVSITGPKMKYMYSNVQFTKSSKLSEFSSKIIKARVNKKQIKAALMAYSVKIIRISTWGSKQVM